VAAHPTTRTYVGDTPILGYADVANEENNAYPFFNGKPK